MGFIFVSKSTNINLLLLNISVWHISSQSCQWGKKGNHTYTNKIHMYIYTGIYLQKKHTYSFTHVPYCTIPNNSTKEASLYALFFVVVDLKWLWNYLGIEITFQVNLSSFCNIRVVMFARQCVQSTQSRRDIIISSMWSAKSYILFICRHNTEQLCQLVLQYTEQPRM